MDKNIIKNRLSQRFISEETTPGIAVTAAAQKKSGEINKAGVKAVEKDVTAYDKSLKKENPDMGKMAKNKYNYTDDAEKTYHDEMEILNGQEMIEYTSEPGAEFKKRAEESLEGSSRMGNEGKIGNAEETWGASSDDFGKNLIKRVKDSSKKRADAEIQTYGMGDVQIPTGNKVQVATTAIGAGKPKGDTTKAMQSASDKTKTKVVKEGISDKNIMVLTNWVNKMGAQKAAETLINKLSETGMISDLPDSNEYGQGLNKVAALLTAKKFDMAYTSAKNLGRKLEKKGMRDMYEADTKEPENDGEDYEKIGREVEYGINPNSKDNDDKNNNKKPQIKESMKRLKFNKDGDKPFQGVNTTQKLGHALTLIPEAYKVDKKEFEMTDGVLTARIRWEGSLTEGKAVVTSAADKKLVNEDMSRMKALMGYKSQDTLGNVKGNARLDENKVFGDIWNKSKRLLGENEDIEDADVIDGSAESLDDAVNHAAEAKKHVEGSVSTDDGTQAPAPKKGEWEKIAVKHAPEAKKHVEGSVAEVKKTEAPAPKVGNWEEIKKKSTDASKDVESGKPSSIATDKPKTVAPEKVVNEGFEDDEESPEAEDTYNKPDADDMGHDDSEPSTKDIQSEVPPAIGGDDDDVAVPAPAKAGLKAFVNQETGEHFLLDANRKHVLRDAGGKPMPIPAEYVELAKKNPTAALSKIEDALDAMGGEEELDEYGDEHQVSTKDALAGMNQNKTEMEEGLFGGGNELSAAKASEFDKVNASLVGTKGDQTANKEKWLARAKNDDNFKGQFVVDRGVLQYKNKSSVPSTGKSSGYSEGVKRK